jgi:hypothetical protein
VKKPGGTGHRGLRERVKTGAKRTASSNRWLERQINDPYVARSKQEGYRSRAAYKLLEIDDRYGMLRKGQRVVDLGAAPGGWSQVAATRTGSTDTDPRIVAIDYLGMDALPGVVILEKDSSTPMRPKRSRRRSAGRAPTLCCRTWLRRPPGTARPTISGSWRSAKRRRNLPARCWLRAALSSPRSSGAAPKECC